MQQERLVEDLRGELARGEVFVVVGTGVSIQATGGKGVAPCATWDGLILDGIAHAAGTTLLPPAAADDLRARLGGTSVDARLEAGDRLTEALRPDFGRWLRDSVGRLPLKDRSIIDAVHALGAPIATTNYDDLLTQKRPVTHVPWTDTAAAAEILHGDRRNAVLHLHGCFCHPDSVILGRQSYQTLLESQGAQAVQQGMAATRSLLFIGCGDGLSDPNLGGLLQWIGEAFGNTMYRHYRLCLASEQKEPDGRLFYVAYGDRHDELVPFLRELAPRKPVFTLPHPGYCFGREREVEEVVTALLAKTPQPLPILGGPGMGKTTIALKALHDRRVAEKFRERRWFVRCDGTKTRADLAGAIALALGLPIVPDSEQSVLAALAEQPGALILDNAETSLDAERERVEQFLSVLATIESLALVVTIRGHRRPRGVPWLPDIEAKRLTDVAAAKVFVAVSGKPSFANDPHLPQLLVALDGVALAITLMARYAEMFDSLEPAWSRWKAKRTAMLRDGEEPDRLKNIAVSYELSFGVLGAAARRLLSVLALLPDGVAYRDLEGVFVDPDDATDELRRRALVFDEELRLRMRAPLREYVAAAHPAEVADARRVVDYYLTLSAIEGAKVGALGGAEAVARLALEVANVEALFGKSLVRDDSVVVALYGWTELMRFTGLGSTEPIEQIAAAAVVAGLTDVAARAFTSLGEIALYRSDPDTARARYEEALPLYRKIGDLQGEAKCVRSLGDIVWSTDPDTARARYEEALPLYRQAGSVQGEATCITSLGDIALERSDLDTAWIRYEEALPLYLQDGSVLGEANCVQRLGDIALRRSDPDTARARCEEALALYRKIGDVRGEANGVQSLGDIALRLADYDTAQARYEEALALHRKVGDVHGEATHINSLGDIALRRSNHETAQARYEEALPLYQKAGSVRGEANCIWGFGNIASAKGDRSGAETKYRQALALYERVADPFCIGGLHRRLAWLASDDASRSAHLNAARDAWRSIKRDNLVVKLDEEFGDE